MTNPEAIAALYRIKAAATAFDETWDKVCEFFHAHPESPLFESFAKMETAALDMFALASGIHADAVNWFVYDNEWGNKAHGVLHGAVLIPMDSIEAFVAYESGEFQA